MLKKASAILIVLLLAFGFLGLSAGSYNVLAQEDDFTIEPYEDDFWEDDTFYEEEILFDDTTTTDESIGGAFTAFMAAYMFGIVCVGLITYIVYALALSTVGKKLSVENGWMAWVPVFNIFYFVKLAGFSGWYFLVFLIPFVNILFSIYCWMKIAERRGWDAWLGLLTIIPILNYIMPLYFAWGEPSGGGDSTPAEAVPVE